MALISKSTLVLLVTLNAFLAVEWSANATVQTAMGLKDRITFGCSNKTDASGSSFITLMRRLFNSALFNIQLLYDRGREEKAQSLLREISSEMSGLMTFHSDTYPGTVDMIVRSAAPGTSLLTLCSFQKVLDIFQRIKAKRTKSHLVNWILLFEKGEVTNKSMAALQNLIFEGTHVTIVNQETSGKFFVFSANVMEDGVSRFAYKGQWSSTYEGKRAQLLLPLYDLDPYRDMKGRQLLVAANEDPPDFVFGKPNDDGSIQAIGGIDLMIVRSLSEVLNFTFKIFPSVDGAWGYPQPNGNITGIIGMTARREAHLGVCGIAVNELRNTVIDYSVPYSDVYTCIFSRALSERGREFAILAPFSLKVWIGIVITTLAIGPILRLQSEISEKFSPRDSKWDIQTYSLNMFRNLVQQSNLLDTENLSQRIVFFFWYIFCLVVCVLYSAKLTAVLAIPVYEKPVDSLEDLPEAVGNGFTPSVIGDTINEYMFKDAIDGIMKQTWGLFNHKDRSKSFVNNTATGMRLVLQEKSVHIGPCTNGKIIAVEMGEQKFYVGRDLFYPKPIGFVYPQGAPYQRPFNKVIRRLVAAGMVRRWYEVEIHKIPKKHNEQNEVSSSSAITLTHLQAAFFMMLLGYLAATMALLAERAHWALFRNEQITGK